MHASQCSYFRFAVKSSITLLFLLLVPFAAAPSSLLISGNVHDRSNPKAYDAPHHPIKNVTAVRSYISCCVPITAVTFSIFTRKKKKKKKHAEEPHSVQMNTWYLFGICRTYSRNIPGILIYIYITPCVHPSIFSNLISTGMAVKRWIVVPKRTLRILYKPWPVRSDKNSSHKSSTILSKSRTSGCGRRAFLGNFGFFAHIPSILYTSVCTYVCRDSVRKVPVARQNYSKYMNRNTDFVVHEMNT